MRKALIATGAILLFLVAVNHSFTADVGGTYEISLVVNDGKVDGAADQVTSVTRGPMALNYLVSDAEYSKQLDNIIMVSSSPKQLHIYDPKTDKNKDIDLPLNPTCVSVSHDGLYAAVGHDGWISYVNLTTAALEKTFSVTADVLDIVLAGNGYVYAFPRRDQWESIRCVEIETEIEKLGTEGSIYAGTLAKLHPNGSVIYGADNGLSPSDIEKYSIVNGTAEYLYDSPYHGDYPMCGDLWISEDGLRIFTRCGNVFRSSELRSQDMTYNGSLSELSLIEHLSHSSSTNKVIAIPGADWDPPDDEDTELKIYDYNYLNYEKSVPLPDFIVNGKTYPGHGRYVFSNSDGSAYYVVMQADETSGMLYDFGVATYFPESACGFVDVPPGYWAAEAICKIYDEKITTGCSTNPLRYCPQDDVTRAQMAAFLIRAVDEAEPPANYCDTGSPFSDVSPNHWACKYIKRLLELEITTGCGDSNYCPNDTVTRAQMAAFLVRAVDEAEPPANYCSTGSPFSDVPTDHWACKYIKRLSELEITTGCGGSNYCPNDLVTRAQMAAFLSRAFLEME